MYKINCCWDPPTRILIPFFSGLVMFSIATQPAWTQPFQQIEKFEASDGQIDDAQGYFVDLDAGTAIVGTFPFVAGAAYLFDTGTLQQTHKLTVPGITADDFFGSVVSIGGNTALVGAPGDTTLGAAPAGGVYAFDVATGVHDAGIGKITPNDSASGDEFGFALAQDGSNAIVGAPVGGIDQGKAYLIDASTGGQVGASLVGSDGFAADNYGFSVDVAGDWALVGAPADQGLNRPGNAYLYDLANNRQEIKLMPPSCPSGQPGCQDGNEFGWSVSLFGNKAAVGAPNRGAAPGQVYIYNDLNSVNDVVVLTPPSGSPIDEFGYAVNMWGDLVAVGVPDDRSNRVFVYRASTGEFLQELIRNDGTSRDEFGFSVVIEGNQALIGAPAHNDFTGAGYLFSVPEPATTALLVMAWLTAWPWMVLTNRRRPGC